MKARMLLVGLMTVGITMISFGQEKTTGDMKTIFGNKDSKIDHGGYGAIILGYTQIDGHDVMTLGGRAAWIIDHHVAVGLAGKAIMTSVFIEGDFPNTPDNGLYMSGGYGGFFIEPIIFPQFPIHASFPVLIGGGGFVLNEQTWHDYSYDYEYYEPYAWDSYFVVEPGVEVELNVVKFFRVAFGASYRFTSNLHISEVPKDMMNGFNADVTFKFGWF